MKIYVVLNIAVYKIVLISSLFCFYLPMPSIPSNIVYDVKESGQKTGTIITLQRI